MSNSKTVFGIVPVKTLRKVLIGFLLLIIVLIITAIIASKIISKKGLPDYSADIILENMIDSVVVYRDDVGTPHIYAHNEGDLYRATGFIMAQERMWQMDLLRRVTLGRLSEIFGADMIETDLLLRSLRYPEKSAKVIEETPAEILSALTAFTDGVNQYLGQYKDNLPLEFFLLGYKPEKWEIIHSVNLISFMAWDLKAGWNEFILEAIKNKIDSIHFVGLLPDVTSYKSVSFNQEHLDMLSENNVMNLDKLTELGADVLCGSNNWAVAGKKSITGKPILASDMHLNFNVPGIWIQMHQKIEGKLNVSGLVLPGQPLVIVGHNDSIAWGMTNVYADNIDFYEERINPADSNQYLFKGEWRDFTIVPVKIKVKNSPDYETSYKLNHRGPVVSRIKKVKNKVLTIKWAGDMPSNEIKSVYEVNRASNWQEFREAFSTFRSIGQNIAYADAKGNIGLQACVGIPIRKRNNTFEVLPGWTDEYDWQGVIPFDELPSEYNPERGYISSANNRTIDTTYPYHIGSWYAAPYRIERIRELLESKEKFSVDDFITMQLDTKSKLVERLNDKCFTLLLPSDFNKNERKAYELLDKWDGNMDASLVQPALVEVFLYMLMQEIFKDELGEELFNMLLDNRKLTEIAIFNLLSTDSSAWINNIETDKTENFEEVVNAAFKKSIEYLTNNFGANINAWKWGRIHTITLPHPLSKVEVLDKIFKLNRGPYAVGGSTHTVSPFSYSLFKPTKIKHGASHRHIFSLDNWDLTLSVIPTGNSGIVSSEFYCDQTDLYINGLYHADYFSDEIISKKFKYKIDIIAKSK